MTQHLSVQPPHFVGRSRVDRRLLALAACLALATLSLSACHANETLVETAKPAAGHPGMAGPAVSVTVTREAIDGRPGAPNLTSPEAAVRSYLAWISYAYRIGQSKVAVPTMTSYQEVRVDSYVQYNLQKRRLVDQTLLSIAFGAPTTGRDRALISARERWRYRYVSATAAGKVIGGPYEVSYDATYTVTRNAQGAWQVDGVQATTSDAVK